MYVSSICLVCDLVVIDLLCCLKLHLKQASVHLSYYDAALAILQICRIWLDQIDYCHVTTRFSHVPCGHFVNTTSSGIIECKFCHVNCEDAVVLSFHLKITLADDSGKVFAWCTGQTAAELLQISPDEFCELPEVIPEQFTVYLPVHVGNANMQSSSKGMPFLVD